MKFIKNISKNDYKFRLSRLDQGFTFVEMILGLTILVVLTTGVIQLFQLSSKTIQSDTAGSIRDASSSILRRTFKNDVQKFDLVSISKSRSLSSDSNNLCSSWNPLSDPQSRKVRPFLTFIQSDTGLSAGYEFRQAGSTSELWKTSCQKVGSIPTANTLLIRGFPTLETMLTEDFVKLSTTKINAELSTYTSDFPRSIFVTINSARQRKLIVKPVLPTDVQISLRNYDGLRPGMYLRAQIGPEWKQGFPNPSKSSFTIFDTFTVSSSGAITGIKVVYGDQQKAESQSIDASIDFYSYDAIQLDFSSINLPQTIKNVVTTATRRAS